MLKSKTPVSESLSHSVTGVGIELSQTTVWTAKKLASLEAITHTFWIVINNLWLIDNDH